MRVFAGLTFELSGAHADRGRRADADGRPRFSERLGVMFKMLTDAIDNTLSVVGGVLTGELPTQRQVAQMISDGMTIAAIAAATGLAVEVIEKIVAGDDA